MEKALELLLQHFPHTPTEGQLAFFYKFTQWLDPDGNRPEVMVLRGYAGTGKTSVLQAITQTLPKIGRKVVLMAPTGRAAKVMSGYTGLQAQTIHRRIYHNKKDKAGQWQFTLQANKFVNALFVVDEASMVHDQSPGDRSSSLLQDVLEFTLSGKGCQLLLLGDMAQLPPVMSPFSPALDPEYIESQFGFHTEVADFNEVMRQAENSGILLNATRLRSAFQDALYDHIQLRCQPYQDIQSLTSQEDVLDAIYNAYSQYGESDTCFIVRSNKRANQFNQHIRARILQRESQLSVGDLIMAVKNNYFWLDPDSDAGFIANGDILEVMRIAKFSELYGFSFAHARVRMLDYPQLEPFDTVLLLDTLSSEAPALTSEQSNRLYQEVMQDYMDEKSPYKRSQKLKTNAYFNAIQIKFAYAVTCHKAQGGQWPVVFIEQPYLPQGPDIDFIRWLYTALTRAQQQVYLLGFQKDYLES